MSNNCKKPNYIIKADSSLTKGEKGEQGNSGQSSFVYIRYASDQTGTDFSSTPDINRSYIGIIQSNIALTPIASDFTFVQYIGQTGQQGQDGAQNFIYFGYADNINGTGFTLTFDPAKQFIAILNSNIEILNPTVANFVGLWTKYIGIDGTDGTNFYGYIGYADDILGNGFTLTFDSLKTHIAILTSTTEIANPVQSDFNGLWARYIGFDGTDGREIELQTTSSEIQWRYVGQSTWNTLVSLSILQGQPGLAGIDGADVFLYIAYSDDTLGTNFTLTFDPSKEFIAILRSEFELTTISVTDFTGLWTRYKGDGDRWSTTSITSTAISTSPMSLVVETDLAYTTGQKIVAAQAGVPENRVEGVVQSYNKSTGLITIDPENSFNTGTVVSNWEVNISGSTSSLPSVNNNIDGGGIDSAGQITPKIDGGSI